MILAGCAPAEEQAAVEAPAPPAAPVTEPAEPVDSALLMGPELEPMALGPFRLIRCPGGDAQPASRTIPPGGGAVEHPTGHRLRVGSGVVTSPTAFVIREVPGQHMRVLVRPTSGSRARGDLELTIDYSRCPADEVVGRRLRILRLNPPAPPDDEGGDTIGNRRIRARVDSLSVFAIGF